ncbi:H-NS family nucleoid-associated regulatory protein [Rhodosalinus sp. FB01]|uniref:H-NS histone family protein n=1 Tax=Rhodosalinus sp. FB01 TaxID=3239194 RepID=UPI003525423E
MNIDLYKMSGEELKQLRADIDKALETIELRRKAEALKAAEDAAKAYGFSLNDLKEAGPKGSKNPPKYANPADPRQTWTGRGRKPQWVNEALKAGKTLEDLSI